MVRVETAHTARVPAEVLRQGRELMAVSFNNYSDDDWTHALGGEHAWIEEDGRLVAHGSVVQRHCYLGEELRVLRVGYVDQDEAEGGDDVFDVRLIVNWYFSLR